MKRITVDPKVMGGVPCLRGLRIPVATVVNMVAGGMTVEEIVDELPPLEADDVADAHATPNTSRARQPKLTGSQFLAFREPNHSVSRLRLCGPRRI